VSGSGISWAICKSAPRPGQITTPAPHHSVFFTGRMPFLLQRQSTDGAKMHQNRFRPGLCPPPTGELRRCPRPPSRLRRGYPQPTSPSMHSVSRCPVRFLKYDHVATLGEMHSSLCSGCTDMVYSKCAYLVHHVLNYWYLRLSFAVEACFK